MTHVTDVVPRIKVVARPGKEKGRQPIVRVRVGRHVPGLMPQAARHWERAFRKQSSKPSPPPSAPFPD